MKYNISMDDDLAKRVDEFVKKNHTNRSNLIAISLTTYMDAMEKIPSIQSDIEGLKGALGDIQEAMRNLKIK